MDKIYRVKLNSKGAPNFATAEVIDAVEVVRGHYIKGSNGEWYCSNCKRIDDKYSVANYCWYCGAKMKGADDE